jgi:hypothetical protein
MHHISVVIHRDGSLFRFDVSAPGVRGARLFRCLEPIAATWRFPVRKGFTTAAVPFRYVHTAAPGAGPYKTAGILAVAGARKRPHPDRK